MDFRCLVESAAISTVCVLPEYLGYFVQVPMYLDSYCAYQTQRLNPFSHLWHFPNVHFLVLHLYKFWFSRIIKFAVSLGETICYPSKLSDTLSTHLLESISTHAIIPYALLQLTPCIAFVFIPFKHFTSPIMSPHHALSCHLAKLPCRISSCNLASLFTCGPVIFGGALV